MKTILITGVNRGLGRSLKSFFLKNGFSVIGTTRNVRSVFHHKNLKVFYLDLTSHKSIDDLIDFFLATKTLIDVVIHNAGVAYLAPADILEEQECRNIFDVNFFGPIYLTKKLLTLLKKKSHSNLIFISSIVSVDHWPYLGVYAASKSALETVAFEWAVLLKKWNIYVSIIQPNPLPTNMQILQSKNFKCSPYPRLKNRKLMWEKKSDVCKLILKILNKKTPKFQYQTGQYSTATVQRFLKKNIYQKTLIRYQKQFNIL